MVGRTSVTLLELLKNTNDDEAWSRFCAIYGPLIRGWLVRRGLNQTDADDAQQCVMAKLMEKLPEFEHNGNAGAFRLWLRNIVANRLTVFWREKNKLGGGTGGEQIAEIGKQLADPNSNMSRLWNEEYDKKLCERLLELAEPEFQPQTMQAFRRVALDDEKTSDVADELGISANAVRIAKARVLQRLRELGEGFLEE